MVPAPTPHLLQKRPAFLSGFLLLLVQMLPPLQLGGQQGRGRPPALRCCLPWSCRSTPVPTCQPIHPGLQSNEWTPEIEQLVPNKVSRECLVTRGHPNRHYFERGGRVWPLFPPSMCLGQASCPHCASQGGKGDLRLCGWCRQSWPVIRRYPRGSPPAPDIPLNPNFLA